MDLLSVTNSWTQLLLLISASILCVVMSAWFGTHHFRVRKHMVGVAVPAPIMTVRSLEPHAPTLQITSVVHHGRIIEIKGATDAGTVVMINGQPVASIFPEHTFKHFLGPLPAGTTIVSITCQDEQGGVNTQQLAVTVE